MSTIGSVSGLSNLSYVPPATNGVQRGGGDADGDGGGSSSAGRVGRGNLMQAIEQALGQSLGGSTAVSSTTTSGTTSSTNRDPVAAVQAFMQNLFTSLHQGATNQAFTGGADRDGDSDGSGAAAGVGQGGSGMAAKIQNLLQQLSASSQDATGGQGGASNALGNLNSSFQDMINALGSAQGGAASPNSQTLQTFLQNLAQNLSNGQSISGALVSAQA